MSRKAQGVLISQIKEENEYVMPKGEWVLLKEDTTEQKIITNNLFNNLTVEAKFVLYAVFQTPGELSQMLFANRPTKKTIYKYLKLMGWKMPAIRRTVQELRWFTKEITHEN